MRTVYIFDIDSTIANNDERAKLLDKYCVACLYSPINPIHGAECPNCGGSVSAITQESWDSFLQPELMLDDKPIEKAVKFIHRLRELGSEFHFITGRSPRHREVTEQWLNSKVGRNPAKEHLLMRTPEDIELPASIYKDRAFNRLLSMGSFSDCNFIFFEDDPHVFSTYSKYGVVVQCPQAWDFIMPESSGGIERAWQR